MPLTFESLPPDLREKLINTPAGQRGKFSLTREGLETIFPALLKVAKERGYDSKDLTSHDCTALFKGKKWKDAAWTDKKYPELQFHPVEKFPELYSNKMPDRMGSYTWAGFRLIKDLKRALDEYEITVPPNPDGQTTYWFDILINDQNNDIENALDIADALYSGADRHFAFMCGNLMERAWCISEIITRFVAALKMVRLWKEGQDNTEAIIKGGALLRTGHPAFTVFVAIPGLTDLERDVAALHSSDRFMSMKAYDPNDLEKIQLRSLQIFGSPERFNFITVVIRDGVLHHYANAHPVRRHIPHHRVYYR